MIASQRSLCVQQSYGGRVLIDPFFLCSRVHAHAPLVSVHILTSFVTVSPMPVVIWIRILFEAGLLRTRRGW